MTTTLFALFRLLVVRLRLIPVNFLPLASFLFDLCQITFSQFTSRYSLVNRLYSALSLSVYD